MTLKPLLSFLRSREQSQDNERGLILSQRLRELLHEAQLSARSTPNQTDVARDSDTEQRRSSETGTS
jgi:hypothetical protein